MPNPRRRPRASYETRLFWLSLAGGALPMTLSWYALGRLISDPGVRSMLQWVMAAAWLGCALLVRERVVRPLQTLSNMLAAMREGDTSIRARGADPETPMGLAMFEVNALTETLRRQKFEALTATALLSRVMDSIDVAVFAFDPERRLRMVNREGEELLGEPSVRSLGRDAASLGLLEALQGETPRLAELRFPTRSGRWELRRGSYRQDGRPHELLVLSDLSRSLREEEHQAWLRLIRVLSHEINNSLAPIQSIAGSLQMLIERGDRKAEREEDMRAGLRVIESRSQALGRFMHAYARLARLPRPTLARVQVREWVEQAAALERRVAVGVKGGPEATLEADRDQLEQLLINLVRNAADAALETGGGVWLAWETREGWLELRIEDEGPGLAETANLFVPFFTTKPEGTGIGLALSRQIAEAHGGGLTLVNRAGASGCVASVRLPLASGGRR